MHRKYSKSTETIIYLCYDFECEQYFGMECGQQHLGSIQGLRNAMGVGDSGCVNVTKVYGQHFKHYDGMGVSQ